ncbi:MAG: DMT family transporter [Pseudomonadota bacterium]
MQTAYDGHAPDASRNTRGIIAMLAAMACYITNDVFVKLASDALPTGQIIFFRGLFGTVFIAGAITLTSGMPSPRSLVHWSVILRTVCEIAATFLYLSALFRMPIANATAILQAMPLFITALAVIVLGERVGWRRWLAISVGFVGMLLVVQPGLGGFNAASLLVIAAMVAMAGRDISTRFIPADISSQAITLLTAFSITIAAIAFVPFETWQPMNSTLIAHLICAAVFLAGGYLFITLATRSADISAIAPFRYSILVWAFIYGVVIWGDWPNPLALFGMAIIVSSGLYVFHRERLKASDTTSD